MRNNKSNPTTIPAIITLKALIKCGCYNYNDFNFFVSTPKALASFHLDLKAFKYFEKKIKIKIPKNIGIDKSKQYLCTKR